MVRAFEAKVLSSQAPHQASTIKQLRAILRILFKPPRLSDVNGLDWIQKSLQIQSKNQIRLLNRLRNRLNQIIQIYIQLYRESWLGVRAKVRFIIGKRLWLNRIYNCL